MIILFIFFFYIKKNLISNVHRSMLILLLFFCLIVQVDGPLYMRKIPLGVRPVFVFIFRLILVFSKTTKKHLQFYFFQNKQYKICTKRLFNDVCVKKSKVISTVVLLSISNARGLSCGIWGIFSKNTSEHEFVIWWFFFLQSSYLLFTSLF